MFKPFRMMIRLLTFRITEEELRMMGPGELALGIMVTWIVGMGRYWDHPRAEPLQRLGVGSLIYVFALAAFLCLLVWPLRPHQWRFSTVLTFITLLSLPALLYAIPVERYYRTEVAGQINVWFLAVVAVWRVALLVFFLLRYARLSVIRVFVATMLPLTIIVTTLTALNLEKVAFDLMSGVENNTASDAAYGVLFLMSMLSVVVFPVVALLWVLFVLGEWSSRRRLRAQNLG